MKHAILAAILCLLLPAVDAAIAQTTAVENDETAPPAATGEAVTEDAEQEGEPAADEPRIKVISLTLEGGWFSGATYFELPAFGDRTEIAEGGNLIYSFDNKAFTPPTLADGTALLYAPEKKIESGYSMGGRIGFFLSEAFHIDLVASVSKSKAVTTFMWDDPAKTEEPYRVNLDEATDPDLLRLMERTGLDQATWTDDSFTVYKGGGSLLYDGYAFRILGLVPSFGIGVGGIINRFSELPDKTALYFELSAGLKYELAHSVRLSAMYNATMLSFDTEEVQYGRQVTYGTAFVGLTWMSDVSNR